MPLEKTVETRTCARLRDLGCVTLKAGEEGWPDRLVLVGSARHFWIEFKTKTGRLRPVQVARLRNLERLGERVLVLDTVPEVANLKEFVHACRRGEAVRLPEERG
jgi:hypothetical protein